MPDVKMARCSPDLLDDSGPNQVDALVMAWNETRIPGPHVREISPSRRRLYQRALAVKPNLDDWRTVIRWLNGQAWCNASGRGDHPNWRADLDWVAKPGQLVKLLDRVVADQAKPGPAGVQGRNAAKGRTGYKRGEFADALKGEGGGNDGAIH